jgi:antitoxin ParD1/3/4
MPTRNINLTEHFDQFVTAEIESGRYSNASEVLRAGLRLLERQKEEDEQRLERLRALAQEGFSQLDQGLGIRLNGREEIAAFMDQISEEVRAQQASVNSTSS